MFLLWLKNNVERKKKKNPFPKTKLARCTGKGVAFKKNVELKNDVKLCEYFTLKLVGNLVLRFKNYFVLSIGYTQRKTMTHMVQKFRSLLLNKQVGVQNL
ncbi:hypothetical protein EMST110833_14310 [Empedobacter stercoris]